MTEQCKPTAGLTVAKHPGPFTGPDAELARACAMAVIPFYGTDDAYTHRRIMEGGVWNDHVAVQAALAAIYNTRQLAERVRELENRQQTGRLTLDSDKCVFFYEQEFYVLSNFSAFRLMWRGRDFDTSEAAYHWERFATGQEGNRSPAFGSMAAKIADDIRFAPSAHEAFRIAQENKFSQRPDWDNVKVGIMRDILCAKANQHEYVRRKLLETGERELIEHSWRDDFWGWGPNREGKNMLGKLWMEIRAELRATLASTKTGGES